MIVRQPFHSTVDIRIRNAHQLRNRLSRHPVQILFLQMAKQHHLCHHRHRFALHIHRITLYAQIHQQRRHEQLTSRNNRVHSCFHQPLHVVRLHFRQHHSSMHLQRPFHNRAMLLQLHRCRIRILANHQTHLGAQQLTLQQLIGIRNKNR